MNLKNQMHTFPVQYFIKQIRGDACIPPREKVDQKDKNTHFRSYFLISCMFLYHATLIWPALIRNLSKKRRFLPQNPKNWCFP